MNLILASIWLASAAMAGVALYRVRRSVLLSLVAATMALGLQTGWAFAALGLAQSVLRYQSRAALIDDLMGPSLAFGALAFWVHLLCRARDSRTRHRRGEVE